MIALLILLIILLLFAATLLGYIVVIYNGLVRLKNNIDKSWSNIDVLLKQRFDELPKLVKICEGYMQHERQTLENVIKARSMVDKASSESDVINANNAITQALRSLFAVSENYPELKADTSFRQLQSRVSEVEDQIADRREFFNESVNLYNIHIEQFPDIIVARKLNYKPKNLWKIDPADRSDVQINITQPTP